MARISEPAQRVGVPPTTLRTAGARPGSTPCDPTCLFPTGVRAPAPVRRAPVSSEVDPPVARTLTGGDHRRRADQWRDVLRGTTPERTAESAVRTTGSRGC